MNLADILKFLVPFEALLKPGLLQLEGGGNDELKKLIEGVQSPDLKEFLQALDAALDSFAKNEIGKLS